MDGRSRTRAYGTVHIEKDTFKSVSRLIIFDYSNQNESTKYVDIKIEFEAKNNIPTNTSAYCLIIHDRIVEYKPMEGDVRVLI